MKKLLIKRIIIIILIFIGLWIIKDDILKQMKLKSDIEEVKKEIEDYNKNNKLLREQIKNAETNLKYIENRSREYNMVKEDEKVIIIKEE